MKRKITSLAIVVTFISVSFAIMALPQADAVEVGPSVFSNKLGAPAGIEIKDIAWNTQSTYALIVGWDSNGDGLSAYWYIADENQYQPIPTTPWGTGYTLNAVTYNSVTNNFYAVGSARSSQTTCYRITAGGSTFFVAPGGGAPPITTMYDIDFDQYGNLWTVGPNDGVHFYSSNSNNWLDVPDNEDGGWDYYAISRLDRFNRFYFVGGASGGGQGIIAMSPLISSPTYSPTGHFNYMDPTAFQNYSTFHSIDWNNNPGFLPADDYALVGGEDSFFAIGGADGGHTGIRPMRGNYEDGTYLDICWDETDWSEATIVNQLNSDYRVMLFDDGIKSMVTLNSTASTSYVAVDYKPPASPGWASVVGSGGLFKLNPLAFDSGTEITVSSDEPHIFDVDMWETSAGIGGPSKLNQQVDVEDTYTFFAEFNYTVGVADEWGDGNPNVRILLTAWHDGGNAPSAVPTSSDSNRNEKFIAAVTETAGGYTSALNWPLGSPGQDEFVLESTWVDPVPASDSYRVYFNVTFGPQMRAGDGGGFGNGAAGTIYDSGQALNDPGSWDFNVSIWDNNFPGAMNNSYEEFGIFKFTNMTVSGNPYGNAPPGSSSVALSGYSQINYSANLPYYVNVSIPDLQRDGGGAQIARENVNISFVGLSRNLTNNSVSQINGTGFPYGVPFNASGAPLGIWGNASDAMVANWTLPAPENGTISHGPWGSDFNAYTGPTQIEWFVTIPAATPEGVYRAIITFTIGYYG